MHTISKSLRNWIFSFAVLLPVLVGCDRFADLSVARLVKEHLYRDPSWMERTAGVPDLLLQLVVLTTASALLIHFVRARRGIHDRFNRFLILVSWSSPVAYLAKAALKPVFGRANNRLWLQHPELYGFHWFRLDPGFDAFPSGHMLVVVALMSGLVRFYPKARPYCFAIGGLLALALILTAYHFLSDIIAGTYVGIAIEAALFAALSAHPDRLA